MRDKKLILFPVFFTVILLPVFVVALISYQPGKRTGKCPDTTHSVGTAAHPTGTNIATETKGDRLLTFSLGPAVELFQVVNGNLQVCGQVTSGDLKHVAIDVNNARLTAGEPLPARVDLTLRQHDNGNVVVQAGLPAIYEPGYGYYFGDNLSVPPGATYDWTVIVSPVKALRQVGTQDLWLEPVEWSGSFTLDAAGQIVNQASSLQAIGEVSQSGMRLTISTQEAQPLYETGENNVTTRQEVPPGSRYFVINITDQAANGGEKLPGAEVTATFRQGSTVLEQSFEAAISPVYGFHYGANVVLAPGNWQITVQVNKLDFLRHASAAVNLPQKPVSAMFDFTLKP